MALSYWKSVRKAAASLARSLLITGFFWSVSGPPAAAQLVKSDRILDRLAPIITLHFGPRTRPSAQPWYRHTDTTASESSRSSSLGGGAPNRSERPKIDLAIYFVANSAEITPAAEAQLAELGEALRSSRLDNAVIAINGHTDARGNEDYNRDLSLRRAEAVKTYLVTRYNIPAANLTAGGYGSGALKNEADPLADENRRVEVVNLGTASGTPAATPALVGQSTP